MPLKNQAMLITYADSLGSNLNDLQKVLQGPLKDVVGGVHILPFFPSSGDRGFAHRLSYYHHDVFKQHYLKDIGVI